MKSDLPADRVDLSDVQGIVRFGYGKLTEACYLLLRIRDVEMAKAWLRAAPVSSAVELREAPASALQLAFTISGLGKLGVREEVLAGFSAEFLGGMAADESRSRRLGDIEANSPQRWEWGGPEHDLHMLVMLFAREGGLEKLRASVETGAFAAAFERLACLPTTDLEGYEPFGFRDGISQPLIDWPRERATGSDEIDYTNIVAIGEFLLGYPNEYGKYTDRPLLDPSDEGCDNLLPAENAPGKRDLARNGTYLVMRQLEQDVPGFWKFLDGAAKSDAAERLRLAEAMVGRTQSGEPLARLGGAAIPGIDDDPKSAPNTFTFDDDARGTGCPFGAHIRRANPRNVDLPGKPRWFLTRLLRALGWGIKSFRDDSIASTRFHRILRRGREYGPKLSIEDALSHPPDTQKRGIHFVCLSANISRQFEFVQNAWLMSTKFNGLTEESDPLMGNRAAVGSCPYTGKFSIQREGAPAQTLTGLPQFVTVRGGAYFFLPSLRALRYFANSPKSSR